MSEVVRLRSLPNTSQGILQSNDYIQSVSQLARHSERVKVLVMAEV